MLRSSASSIDLLDFNSLARRMFEDAVISANVRDKKARLTSVEGNPDASHTNLDDLPDGTSR